MYKRPFILFLLVFYTFSALSQNTDSIAFVTAKWTKKRVAGKAKLITHHFEQGELFTSNQNISYLEVRNNGRGPVLDVDAEVSILKPTSAFGQSANALAAINGTFFDIKNGGSVDFVQVNGTVISETRLDNGSRASHQQAAIVIRDGRLSLNKWDGAAAWERSLLAESVMVTGPLLSLNGAAEALDSSSFNVTRHPRTAVGLKADGRVILLTVDGRNDRSAGMSLFELRKIMKWLGCTSAINLDGGGSTTLWVKTFGGNGVVNYPTDNKLWDHAGERKVANVILLKKKHKDTTQIKK